MLIPSDLAISNKLSQIWGHSVHSFLLFPKAKLGKQLRSNHKTTDNWYIHLTASYIALKGKAMKPCKQNKRITPSINYHTLTPHNNLPSKEERWRGNFWTEEVNNMGLSSIPGWLCGPVRTSAIPSVRWRYWNEHGLLSLFNQVLTPIIPDTLKSYEEPLKLSISRCHQSTLHSYRGLLQIRTLVCIYTECFQNINIQY